MRIAILVERGFQDEEFVFPYYRLLEEGWEVDVATPTGNEVFGKYGIPARPKFRISELASTTYDAVVLPGGFENPDRLRCLPEVINFVRNMHETGKLVAAICHAPSILITADIVRGRKLTAFPSIIPDLQNAGAHAHINFPVVVDGNIITSPHYRNNGDFMREVVKWLKEDHAGDGWDESRSHVV